MVRPTEDHVTSHVDRPWHAYLDSVETSEDIAKSQENVSRSDEAASSSSKPPGIATGFGAVFVPPSARIS